jgi:hypothetical protein
MRITTPGTVVEHRTTPQPQLTYQLRPLSDLVRDLVRDLRPRTSTPKGVSHGR